MLTFVLMIGVSGDLSLANLLVSGLVILGLLWTIRANMSNVYKERAEAAEQEVKDLSKEKLTLSARVAGLEARPDVDKVYALLTEHNERTGRAWEEVLEAMKHQTEVLAQISDRLL